ncbi:MAG: superfamily [Pseudonocardiales bacterium]|nr:superfamily [Pseudonocardiales bacterium]
MISPAWRTRVASICAVALAGFVALAAVVAGGRSTSFDSWMFAKLYADIGDGPAAVLLGASTPALSIGMCGAVALVAAMLRRFELTALAVVAPTLTVVLTKFVLKPLLGRQYGSNEVAEPVLGRQIFDDRFELTGVFPSGHESAVAATACVLVVVAFQLPLTRRWRAALLTVIAAWTLLAAVGLVRNFWHYATDTIGAMLLAITVVFGTALAIDAYGATLVRRLRPAGDQELSRRG